MHLTADRLAELLGVSTKTVRDLAGRGIVVRAGRGRYDERSIPAYCKHLRDMATGKAGNEAVAASAAAARRRLAEAQTEKVELANAHRRGSLVAGEAVLRERSDVLRGVRAGMLAVPSRCGARLPHLTAHDVSEIDTEIRQVLAELGEAG